MKMRFLISLLVVGLLFAVTVPAIAAFALPEMPVTELETAGTAVAALIGVYVVIKFALRMLRGA